MRDYILKRPMLLCAIICVTFSVTAFYSEAVITAFGIFYAIFVGILVFRGVKPQFLVSLVLAFVMLLSLFFTINKAENISGLAGRRINAKAVVCEVEKSSETYETAILEIKDNNLIPNNTKIHCVYTNCKLTMGQTITADFYFKNFTTASLKTSYYSENIFISANLYNIYVTENENDVLINGVLKVRNYIKSTFFSNMNYREAATMCALVFGEKKYFSNQFYNNVRNAGVSHIMVVSGMHLSIIVMLCLYISQRIYKGRYIRAFAISAVVLVLALLCGFTMSILRAGLTYGFMALAIIINRDNTPANTLGLAVVTVLLFSPFAVFNVAFQLSVLSTFGILAVALPIISYLKYNRFIKSKFKLAVLTAVIITISATLLTLPVTIYTFGYVSVVSVFSNLMISFAVTLALCLSAVALLLNLVFPSLSGIVLSLCETIVYYVNSVINFFGSLSFAGVSLPRFCSIIAVFVIILIFYALLTCKKRLDMLKLRVMYSKRE